MMFIGIAGMGKGLHKQLFIMYFNAMPAEPFGNCHRKILPVQDLFLF